MTLLLSEICREIRFPLSEVVFPFAIFDAQVPVRRRRWPPERLSYQMMFLVGLEGSAMLMWNAARLDRKEWYRE